MVAVHTQSAAQCDSLAGLAVNDSVIARRFCSGQFDFKKRDAVGLDTAQPHSRTTKVNLVHVVERVHRTLLRGGLNLYNSTVWTLCRYEKYPRNIQWRDSGTPVQRRRDVRPFLPFINALSGAVASTPLRTRLLQLLFPPVGMTLTLGSVSPRTILPNLTNSSSDMRRRRSRSFCNLDFSGFKSNIHRRSPGRGGILIVPYGADSGRQRKRCTNRCTKPFRPCPISPTVADVSD